MRKNLGNASDDIDNQWVLNWQKCVNHDGQEVDLGRKVAFEYVVEMYIMSQCNSMLVAPSGAARLVGMMKKDYFEHLEYFRNEREKTSY